MAVFAILVVAVICLLVGCTGEYCSVSVPREGREGAVGTTSGCAAKERHLGNMLLQRA